MQMYSISELSLTCKRMNDITPSHILRSVLFRFHEIDDLLNFVKIQALAEIRRIELRLSSSEAGDLLDIRRMKAGLLFQRCEQVSRLRAALHGEQSSLDQLLINSDKMRWTECQNPPLPSVEQQVALVDEALQDLSRYEFLRLSSKGTAVCLAPSKTSSGVRRSAKELHALQSWFEIARDNDGAEEDSQQ